MPRWHSLYSLSIGSWPTFCAKNCNHTLCYTCRWNWGLSPWLRRMAIANGTCVSFCNQPKAQFRRVTPVCRCLHPYCGWRYLATSRESKTHFGLLWVRPWVRPWDNRGECYMDGKRIHCWSNASQHLPIYLQPFTSYSEILVENCNFFLPLAFNAPVGGVPIGIPGKSLDLRKLESWGYQALKTVWR